MQTAFAEEAFSNLRKKLIKNGKLILSGAGNIAAKTLLVSNTGNGDKRLTIYLVNDLSEARTAAAHLATWQAGNVKIFTAESPEESNREHTLRLLAEALALHEQSGTLVLTYADAQVELPDLARLEQAALQLTSGTEVGRTELFADLVNRGYENVDSTDELIPGTYHATGGTIQVWPAAGEGVVTLELDGDRLDQIWDKAKNPLQKATLLPITSEYNTVSLAAALPESAILVADEIVDELEEDANLLPPLSDWLTDCAAEWQITFTSFPEEESDFDHLRFLSVLKFVTLGDLLGDLRSKKEGGWTVIALSKQHTELAALLQEKNFIHSQGLTKSPKTGVTIVPLAEEDFAPQAFQNPELKIALITDREIFGFQRGQREVSEQQVYLDFISSLKNGDYVVHADHGIGIFRGIEQKSVEEITREYLRLDYAAGDKLFTPIDQADKVNRFIGTGDGEPRLTRLGSAEWTTVQRRVAEETEKVAKELLALYASRAAARGQKFGTDGKKQQEFEAGFPYEETPGQLKAIQDVKADMESEKPMDRLVCGDVGFGKTEVALRAAFKAALAGKQVALISPITILADQHYQSFQKRLAGFDITCEMLSRFRTQAEQRQILTGLSDGSVQIVVGTHRLLQEDIKFKNLGLVIIDEEQRFGVQQKERLKKLRSEVDILTLTATPIPRTLNLALNKLRDITTITTPPPGRLPIVTEVRHFNWQLIREAILTELKRGGQVYFLHNRVATIDGLADKLRSLVPEAQFVVTHGKLKPDELEERILDFKKGKYQVLVSSAIIENGIDLPNANTLIVNDADMFGLSQLYQLRGRVGRGRTQAYSYFLYHSRTLKPDAKKRLRAIVEASELGSGFEIAMKDLEIRGAGDILGASQSGAINVVGVSHFVRMLNQAVEDLKAGKDISGEESKSSKEADVALELPLSAYIPVSYISDTKAKIRAYQRLSAADSEKSLAAERQEITEEYGKPPVEVFNLFKVIRLKLACRNAGVTAVKVARTGVRSREAILVLGKKVKPENIMSALSINNKWTISGDRLRIDVRDLGVDWMAGLQSTVEALSQRFRSDAVVPQS